MCNDKVSQVPAAANRLRSLAWLSLLTVALLAMVSTAALAQKDSNPVLRLDVDGTRHVVFSSGGVHREKVVPPHVSNRELPIWCDRNQRVFRNQVAIANAMRAQLGPEGIKQLWENISALAAPRPSAELGGQAGPEPVGQRSQKPADTRLRGQDWSDANAASVLDVLEQGLGTPIVSYESLTPSEKRDVDRRYTENRQKGDDKSVALLGALAAVTVQQATKENPWRSMREKTYLSLAEEAMAKGQEGKAKFFSALGAIEYALFEIVIGSQTRAAAKFMTSSSSGGERVGGTAGLAWSIIGNELIKSGTRRLLKTAGRLTTTPQAKKAVDFAKKAGKAFSNADKDGLITGPLGLKNAAEAKVRLLGDGRQGKAITLEEVKRVADRLDRNLKLPVRIVVGYLDRADEMQVIAALGLRADDVVVTWRSDDLIEKRFRNTRWSTLRRVGDEKVVLVYDATSEAPEEAVKHVLAAVAKTRKLPGISIGGDKVTVVLVGDPNSLEYKHLKEWLEAAGVTIIEAEDFADGYDKAIENETQLIIRVGDDDGGDLPPPPPIDDDDVDDDDPPPPIDDDDDDTESDDDHHYPDSPEPTPSVEVLPIDDDDSDDLPPPPQSPASVIPRHLRHLPPIPRDPPLRRDDVGPPPSSFPPGGPGGGPPDPFNPDPFGGTPLDPWRPRRPDLPSVGHIGGVMLQDVAIVAAGEGANMDLVSGNFSLVVDGKCERIDSLTYRKFVTALWCVYYSDQDPGVSIDPIAPGVNKHLVRYIGNVINTDLARVMREADYTMKQWAVGTERPRIENFFDVEALTAQLGIQQIGPSRQFWFVPEDMRFKQGGGLLLFDQGHMRLKTEYNVPGITPGRAGKEDHKFADFFTGKYPEIAEKYPIFQELFEYAKMVSLAKYLKEQGVPLHWFLMANKHLVLTEDSPGTVDELVKESEHRKGVTITGGVNLYDGRYVFDEATIEAISKSLLRRPPSAVGPNRLESQPLIERPGRSRSFTHGTRTYTVVPQHVKSAGRDELGNRFCTDLAVRNEGSPGLELVRYYAPWKHEGHEFGKGWHLLVPYRVKPADDAKREFLNAVIPKRMVVENLCTGKREVLSFSEDRYSAAGYVPDKLESSQVVGLFLMSNASYRLADKLGNQFHFDQAGYLTDMFLSPGGDHHVHIEYADDFTAAFTKTPYVVRPVGNEKVAFLNVMLPKQVKVTDLVHGDSEVLSFNDKNRIPGYMPVGDKASRYRLLAILSNAGLQLIDKHGNQTKFDPDWKFRRMLPSRERRIVRSISMGGQKATFGYTINSSGEVIIASSSLSANKKGAPVTHVVQYEHDNEGRLCRVRHSQQVFGLQDHAKRDNNLVMSGK